MSDLKAAPEYAWSDYLKFYEEEFLQTFMTLKRQLVWLFEINELVL